MNYSIAFPYLSKLESKLSQKKQIKNQSHISFENSIFSPMDSDSLPVDKAFLNDIEVVDIYKDGASLFHVINEKTSERNFVQSLDIQQRMDNLKLYTGLKIFEMVLIKNFSSKISNLAFDKKKASFSIDFFDNRDKAIKMLDHAFDKANYIIQLGLDTRIRTKDGNYYIEVPSLGSIKIEYPVLSNTAEVFSIFPISKNFNENQVIIELIAGNDTLNFFEKLYKEVKEIDKNLQVSTFQSSKKIKHLIERNASLEEKTENLLNYVLDDYMENLEIPSFEVEDYKIFTHSLSNPYLKDPEDLARKINCEIALITKNKGEKSSFAIKNSISNFDLEEILEKVGRVYPFDYQGEDFVRGEISSEYEDRFLLTFEKYIKEAIKELNEEN